MSEQRKIIHDDNNGLDYVLVGDYYIPMLALPEETRPIGYWGMLRKEYLKNYKPITSMKEVSEQLRKLRRQYLRYQQAEIIYSISHKKLFELASDAGAIYRIDGTVLINRDIFDDYLERFHEPATGNDKEKKTDER